MRDIADLHVCALRTPAAEGQRYIGAGPFYWMSDIARVLREQVPQAARRVPKRSLPSWLVRLSATFDPVVVILREHGQSRRFATVGLLTCACLRATSLTARNFDRRL